MYDLVMRERKHVVLCEGIERAERELVMLEPAMDRVLGHIRQRVVHPAHVPLHAESEATQVGRA